MFLLDVVTMGTEKQDIFLLFVSRTKKMKRNIYFYCLVFSVSLETRLVARDAADPQTFLNSKPNQ